MEPNLIHMSDTADGAHTADNNRRGPGRAWRLGICGTFDVENYGDLLFPPLAEAELTRRLGPLTLHRFSYAHKSPPDWPYAVTPLTELPAMAGGLDALLVGGGHVIRFDKDIAPGYAPPDPSIHHPTGYWLAPMLIALQRGTPVVWNAAGVHGRVPAWADPLMKLAVNESRYVSVRDESSRQALARFADAVEINVVPDTAFGVARLVDARHPSTDFLRLRAEHGLTDPYVVVQATPAVRDFARFAREHRQIFSGHRLLILPAGPCFGEHNAAFGDDLPGLVGLPTWPHPLLLAELIGHAAGVVAISLHLSITALAFGVPVFRPAQSLSAEYASKYAPLSEFDGIFPFDAEDHVDPRRFIGRLGRVDPSPAVSVALRRLDEHWDRITAVLRSPGESPSAADALGRFWQAAPGLLEARDAPAGRGHSKLRKLAAPLRFLGRLRRGATSDS